VSTLHKVASTKRITFFLSLAIVAGGMALSVAGWWFARKQARMADTERFTRMTDRLMGSMKERVVDVEMVLRSERALLDANEVLDLNEWDSFASGVFPLVQQSVAGLTYIQRVSREQLPAFLVGAKIESGSGFTLQTSGDRPELYIVRYAKSFHYPPGIGLDEATDPTRREALERAMFTGRTTLSKHTFLLLENTKRPACLLSIPIYSTGVTPATTEERHKRLQGWVSARIRLDDVISNWSDLSGGQLDYEIYDGRDVISPETFALASRKHLVASTLVPSTEAWIQEGRLVGFRHVDLMGHGTDGWTVCFIATPVFDAAGSHAFPNSILVGGLIVSLLSGWVFWSIGTTKNRSQELAVIMTERFHKTEAEALKLAHIASCTKNAVIVVDVASQVEWVNQSFVRITGYTPAETYGREAVNFIIGPKTDPAAAEEIRKCLQHGKAFYQEILFQHKTGKHFWLDLEIQAVRDTTGRLLYNLVIGIDITERKKAQTELATREAQYRFIFEAAPVGISWRLVRPDGFRVRLMNETNLRICGITRTQIAEPDIFKRITHPEDYERQAELYKKLVAGEITSYALEKRYVRPDGTFVWANFRQLRKSYPNGDYEELGIISDITELKKVQEAAEQANVAKSHFLGTMSHELRTPMNGVVGMASLLLESPLTSEQREFTETIRSSADALLAVLNDILDFSKIDAGHIDLEKEVFSLRECVEGTIDLFSANAAKKGLKLLCEIASDAPSQVRGDVNRLRQILSNLLKNAVKFTEHGKVALSLTASSIDQAAIELHFAVRDTGIGIPPAEMQRLFHSFGQLDASTSRKYGGIGLGLVTSQRLATLMGGRMWAESEEGKGSIFHFTIHTDVVSSKPVPCLDRVRTHLTGKRMLIVDDNAANRHILITLAQNWGLDSRAADSGPAALQLVDSGETFDVGIIDMQMPGMDGVTFGREVRKRSRSEKLPMILLPSVSLHNDLPKDIFVLCLTKPATASQILDAITGILPWEENHPKAEPPPEPTVAAPAAIPARSERILLAEDNVVNQRVALRMLGRLGFSADVAANGAEALSAVHRQRYDIVFMDVQMPEMDGLESTKHMVKEFPARKDRPWIIALTANAMPGDRKLCLSAGMDDFISKPLNLAELSSALERAGIVVAS
jgi:PAS domain S-box-containing protein